MALDSGKFIRANVQVRVADRDTGGWAYDIMPYIGAVIEKNEGPIVLSICYPANHVCILIHGC